MSPSPDSSAENDENDETETSDANVPDGSPSSNEEVSERTDDSDSSEVSPRPREIRLARVSVTRTGHGMAIDVLAGKLRFRLYIDAQWADLVKTIAAGEGELNQFVPFRMAPLKVEADTSQVTPETLEARRIPELSSEHPLFGTPLWNAIFPSNEPPAMGPGLEFDEEPSSSDDASDDTEKS